MRLFVIRHGQVPSNVEGIISGWNDEQLTEKGILQANQIKNQLQNIQFDVVYCSPIDRAKQTAKIVAPQILIRVPFSFLYLKHHISSKKINCIIIFLNLYGFLCIFIFNPFA